MSARDRQIFSQAPLMSPSRKLQICTTSAGSRPQGHLSEAHRVAISNHRLVSFENGEVTFTWRDRAHGSVQKEMKLPAEEFLRRFLLHLLPKGFVRIRNFGFLASRHRGRLLPLCFQCLGSDPDKDHAQPDDAHSRVIEIRGRANSPRDHSCQGAAKLHQHISTPKTRSGGIGS
jgi:hypothetical protein